MKIALPGNSLTVGTTLSTQAASAANLFGPHNVTFKASVSYTRGPWTLGLNYQNAGGKSTVQLTVSAKLTL